jgi:type I restriction enzyme S subunit
MIADLKPYPATKDTGVPWLGEVPEHWEMDRAKWLFRKMDRPVRDVDEVVTCFRDGRVTLRKNRRVRGFTESLKEIGYQGIRRGDLVIHAMDAFAGAIGVADSDGKGTPVYAVCEPAPSANAQYYAYTLREMARSQWIQALAKGIRERSTDFRFDGFGSQTVPLPPPPEEAAIVRFLDHADRRIRRYIRAKQKLIKLLEEQKQAIIHRAVTRGLPSTGSGQATPNVRLKPSGVEWLGDLPEHWEVKKLRLLFRYAKGRRAAELTNEYIGRHAGFFPVYSGQTESNGLRGQIDWYEFDFADPVVFVTTVGARAMSTRLVSGRFSLSQNCALVIPRSVETSAVFFEYVLRRLFEYEKASISLIMQPSLRFSDLNKFYVPCPPPSEQADIVEALKANILDLDRVMDRAQREIGLLREYRTRLIADVVTGKLDVREAAANLPDELDEKGPLDRPEALAEDEEGTDNALDAVDEEAEA